MSPTPRWQHLRNIILSTHADRGVWVGMSLLALALLLGCVCVMLLVAQADNTVSLAAVQWWAVLSVAGLAAMTVFIRLGGSAQFEDPSLTLAQMVWTISSAATAYGLAGNARGIVLSVLSIILFFGTFGLTVAQVAGIGLYALVAFACAAAAVSRLGDIPFGSLDAAYALMALIAVLGCVALNLRIQRIRTRLREQRGALARALAVNRELATRDELTGLLNRRAMHDLLDLEHRRSQRSGCPLLLAQLDIDHFKRINDTHGHATGDRALQAFASTVRSNVRSTDVLARWGGEEFVLMLADTDPGGARDLLERIRLAVAAMEMPLANDTLRMTVSAGLAQHQHGDTVEQTLERADQALYAAKSQGRNRVVVAPMTAPIGTSIGTSMSTSIAGPTP